jgi:hypothetical protein
MLLHLPFLYPAIFFLRNELLRNTPIHTCTYNAIPHAAALFKGVSHQDFKRCSCLEGYGLVDCRFLLLDLPVGDKPVWVLGGLLTLYFLSSTSFYYETVPPEKALSYRMHLPLE